LPAESHGQRSLAGYSPWGHKELNTTEETKLRGKPTNKMVTAMVPQRTAEVHTFRGPGKVSTDLMKGNIKSLVNTWAG